MEDYNSSTEGFGIGDGEYEFAPESTQMVGFAPIMENRTYLANGDPEFKEQLRTLYGSRWGIIHKMYRNLELVNRGTHQHRKSIASEMKRLDRWALCEVIVSQIDLPNYLKKKVFSLYRDMDLRSFKKHEYGVDRMMKEYLIVFSLCVYVYNEAQSDSALRYYPGKTLRQEQKWDGLFRPVEGLKDMDEVLSEFADSLGFEDNQIISCLETIRSQVTRKFGKGRAKTPIDQAVIETGYWDEYINN